VVRSSAASDVYKRQGLGLDSSPGAIAINGTGNQIIPDYTFTPTKVANNLSGLSVQPKKTLALIGGDINVNSGTINANDGRIELVSINSGSANFQPSENGFAFSFDDVDNYQNITLDNLSVLNASGSGGGDIILNAASVALKDGSLILIQNQGNLPSGTLDINATQQGERTRFFTSN
jgi:hypothetical protein